jgi:hypothetical protein
VSRSVAACGFKTNLRWGIAAAPAWPPLNRVLS